MKISFHSHANAISFSYEKISTRTRFEKEAKGNSEIDPRGGRALLRKPAQSLDGINSPFQAKVRPFRLISHI